MSLHYLKVNEIIMSEKTSAVCWSIQVRIYAFIYSDLSLTSIGYSGVYQKKSKRIVIDGGMAKFKILKGDNPSDYWEVPDLRRCIPTSSNY